MEDQIRRSNFDQICRLCLEYASEKNTLFPIFINEANIPGFYGRFLKEFKESIAEVISTCIGIEVTSHRTRCNYFSESCAKIVYLIADSSIRKTTLKHMLQLRKTVDYIEPISTKMFAIERISPRITTD